MVDLGRPWVGWVGKISRASKKILKGRGLGRMGDRKVCKLLMADKQA